MTKIGLSRLLTTIAEIILISVLILFIPADVLAKNSVEGAIAWAEAQGVGDNYDEEHDREWAWWCLHFVGHTYLNSNAGDYSAIDAWNRNDSKYGPRLTNHNPPRGALVFFDATPSNGNVGHVGLSVGDGTMWHAWTDGVRHESISKYDWIPYLGWRWPNWWTDDLPYTATIFNFNNSSSDGWTLGNATSNERFEDGKWVFNAGVDPNVLSPYSDSGVASDQFNTIEVRMSASGNQRHYEEIAYIYYDSGQGFNQPESFGLNQNVSSNGLLDGQYKTYIGSFPSGKQIKQIRFDPLYSNGLTFTPNDTIKIDFIRLVSSYYYWDFTSDSKGWSLGNATSEGFINNWVWQIQPSSGDPQAKSPWLGSVNTGTYKSLYLRYAVNRDQNPNGTPLTGKVYFDLEDDGIEGFTESLHQSFNVIPDSTQREYIIPLPSIDQCKKIHRIRVDFYEGSADEKYKVYLDRVDFSTAIVSSASSSGSFNMATTATATSGSSYITIHEITDMDSDSNSPINIKASANGCCTDQYIWSFIQNPLEMTVDTEGTIAGNTGNVPGVYTTIIRAEDADYPGNYAEESFTINVTSDVDSNSLRIYNDGTGVLDIDGISKQNNSPWLSIYSPYGTQFTIDEGQFKDIFVTVDRQGLAMGNYNDTIIISSDDPNDDPILIPVSLQVTDDLDAPPPPQNVTASPSWWFSSGPVIIDWTQPSDPSGIADAYYKTGSPPTSDTDGTYTSQKPFQFTPATEGTQTLYLWLSDGAGNVNHQNMNATKFYFDSSPPYILSRYPDNGEIDVLVDTDIFVYLQDEHAGIDEASIVLRVNGSIVSPTITGAPNGYSITYSSVQNFGYGETVNVSVEANDLSSPANIMPLTSWTFTTVAAQTAPTLNSFYINNDEESTLSPEVTLNNNVSGDSTEYLASELSDFSDATWLSYTSSPSFTLSEGNGTKIVYLKVRNAVGESNILSDNIILNENCDILDVTAFSGSEIYTPPLADYQYRYGPAIILNGNTVDMWACAPDPSDAWDRIEHRRGTINFDGTIQWITNWTSALERTPNSRDHYSTCDPGVFAANGYYYIGYTSTDQEAGGGATSNDVFVARCDGLPDGSPIVTCEKWNGSGWGGMPQPIIEYNGPNWGVGAPSFVVKNNILYLYYTDNGTKVATADITNVNWPLTLDHSAPPILINAIDEIILGGKPGPFDVKFIDDLARFIGVGVSYEFNPLSNVFVYESLDGLYFYPIATYRDYWTPFIIQDRAHNLGISGDAQGHMQLSATNFIAYGVGRPNGDPNATYNANWPTYLNPIEISLAQINCPIDADGDGYTDDIDCDDRPDGADGISGTPDDGINIYPGAIEICGDGIDQDCDGSDLVCAADSDGDGIYDDGDGSGTVGDNPCTGGATTNCDDNCIDIPNADQADYDSDGVGDVCDQCWDVYPDEPPVITNIDKTCVSELGQSELTAIANDPCDGNLTYTWTPLNGGSIIGSGSAVLFDPPDTGPHPCPYQVELTVTSASSGLEATQIVDLFIKNVGDADGNGVVNLMDKLIVRQHYGQIEGDSNWDARADVTCDGVVNLMDKLKVRQQYGQTDGCVCQ